MRERMSSFGTLAVLIMPLGVSEEEVVPVAIVVAFASGVVASADVAIGVAAGILADGVSVRGAVFEMDFAGR